MGNKSGVTLQKKWGDIPTMNEQDKCLTYGWPAPKFSGSIYSGITKNLDRTESLPRELVLPIYIFSYSLNQFSYWKNNRSDLFTKV